MILSLVMVLKLLALLCFLMGSVNWPEGVRVNVVSLGLFLWLLSTLLVGAS
jgi:hypothetical protein